MKMFFFVSDLFSLLSEYFPTSVSPAKSRQVNVICRLKDGEKVEREIKFKCTSNLILGDKDSRALCINHFKFICKSNFHGISFQISNSFSFSIRKFEL